MPSRRRFLEMMLMSTIAHAGQESAIKLPPPRLDGATLMHALQSRASGREFARQSLPQELLATLLWAAFGVNRPATGGRTAPSAHDWQEIEVYAALAEGVYRYDAAAHALRLAVTGDLRRLTGVQDFVGDAPLNLVYVADFARMSGASAEDRTFFASADAGFIAQNVYLVCASAGLACVVRGLVDRRKLAPAMGLRRDQRIVLAQTVGFPAP
jgi:SagB-type dehydrogenase family enzyme